MLRVSLCILFLVVSAPQARADEDAISDHWAFKAPVKPEPSSAGNPIDAFVNAKLDEQGLPPTPEADKYSLVRRAYLELVGIPPTPDAVEAFVGDERPDAYERLVDELMASPHYGERQAQRWLDAARYADTNGYEKDRPRSIWPYRDWVIDAFNDDMPFDEFTIEQIAGDLLPDATQSQRIATGFHRNAMLNEEGGIDAAEDWYKRTVDRANTTGTVFLGLTMACAQCHDHKFDPIPQKEYYEFFAFFNDASEDTLRLPNADTEAKRARIQRDVKNVEAMMVTAGELNPDEPARLRTWVEDVREKSADWRVAHVKAESEKGATLDVLDDGSILATGDIPNDDTYTVELPLGDEPVSAFRLEVLPHESLPGGGPGRGVILSEGDFLLTEVKAEVVGGNNARAVPIATATADFAAKDTGADKALDGRADTGWSVKDATGIAHAAVFDFDEAIDAPGSVLRVTLEQDYIHQHTIGRFRFSTTSKEGIVVASGVPDAMESRIRNAANADAALQDREVEWYYFVHEAEFQQTWRDRRAELIKSIPEYDSTLIMASCEVPRPTHIYHRGEFLQPREVVEPAVPHVLHDWPEDLPKDRLGLARWLVERRNPLIGRVTMNRLWQQVFGRGLVNTPDDFGVRGAAPSNPELLDWLAVEFMDCGWDLKAMHRLMVTSAAFRRDATVTADAFEADPQNLFLARGPRFRVGAETVRDIALEASGLMNAKIGGVSIYPPQPEGVTALAYGNTKWPTSEGPDRYRRGLYVYWKRTAPYAASTTFDAPSRETACVDRRRTNTPLQALTLMNDEVYTEASRAMAVRVLNEVSSLPERIDYTFMLCVNRPATDNEVQRIRAFHDTVKSRLKREPEQAAKICGSSDEDDPVDLAVWTLICRAVLNLDETITQG